MSYTWDIVTNGLKIIEENGYYPYGLKHSGYNGDLAGHKAVANETKVEVREIPSDGSGTVETSLNQYKFNGQEYQSELALNLYDMDMRDYDPAIGRWLAIDPVTHFSQSPYNAFDGNPVFWADPSGADGQPPVAINTWHMSGTSYATSGGTGQLAMVDHIFGETGDEFWNGFGNTNYTGGDLAWSNYNQANGSTTYYGTDAKAVFEALVTEFSSVQIYLLPESFNFTNTTSNWQAAGVTGLELTVTNLLLQTKSVTFEIEVGLPITLKNKQGISGKLAMTASAEAANQTAAIIGSMAEISKGKFYNAPALVKQTFAKLMQRNLNSIVSKTLGITKSQVGGRVNSQIISNIKPTEAVWGNIGVFQQLGIWMRSWF